MCAEGWGGGWLRWGAEDCHQLEEGRPIGGGRNLWSGQNCQDSNTPTGTSQEGTLPFPSLPLKEVSTHSSHGALTPRESP